MKNSRINWLRGSVAVGTLGLLAACGSQAAVTSAHSAAPKPAVTKTVTAPATVAPVKTKAPVAKPAAAQAPAVPAFSFTNSSAVVDQFYQDISNQSYAAAWALGGDNIGGSSYSQWVAGYATTASISLGSFSQFGSDQVQVDLEALQSDGSVKTYSGTYTVVGGVITAASIVQTDGSAPVAAPAQPVPGSADTSCGGNVYAGPSTSCPFAQSVAAAWDGQSSDVESVYSSVTGQSYVMTYSEYGNLVQVTGGNGAEVLFYS